MKRILETGIRNARNVQRYTIGEGSMNVLSKLIEDRRRNNNEVIYYVDQYFKNNLQIQEKLGVKKNDLIIFVPTKVEPITDYVNSKITELQNQNITKYTLCTQNF